MITGLLPSPQIGILKGGDEVRTWTFNGLQSQWRRWDGKLNFILPAVVVVPIPRLRYFGSDHVEFGWNWKENFEAALPGFVNIHGLDSIVEFNLSKLIARAFRSASGRKRLTCCRLMKRPNPYHSCYVKQPLQDFQPKLLGRSDSTTTQHCQANAGIRQCS